MPMPGAEDADDAGADDAIRQRRGRHLGDVIGSSACQPVASRRAGSGRAWMQGRPARSARRPGKQKHTAHTSQLGSAHGRVEVGWSARKTRGLVRDRAEWFSRGAGVCKMCAAWRAASLWFPVWDTMECRVDGCMVWWCGACLLGNFGGTLVSTVPEFVSCIAS